MSKTDKTDAKHNAKITEAEWLKCGYVLKLKLGGGIEIVQSKSLKNTRLNEPMQRHSSMKKYDRVPFEKSIGAAITHRRVALGYSQEQLVDLADLHRTYISDIERSKRGNFTLQVLVKLAKCLNTSPSCLVEDAEEFVDKPMPESPKLQTKAKSTETTREVRPASKKLPKSSLPGSLAEQYPEIAAQWHQNLNARLKPHKTMPDSTQEICWQCSASEAHSWQAQIGKRLMGKNCPICAR